jgi:polar amino acid transport system substrate-binding protein
MVQTMNRRPLLSALSVVALATSLAACATETTKTSSGVNVVKDGKLTVCTSLPYQPFEFEQDKKVVGFDIDLMDKVAEANDLTVSIVVTAFEGIQSGQSLNTGQCDVAAAGMTITDERAKVIDFSDPYFDATQALLTKDKSYDSLESLAGKKIGVQSGTTGQAYTEANAPKDAEIVVFENLGLETTAVKTGQVDACVQDNGPLLDYVKTNPDTFVTAEFSTGEQYGFAVKKDGNDALLTSINKVIADTKSSGDYDTIYKKWFGSLPTS